MTVVFDRPYQFIPPHRGNLWPSFIQTFRIVDRYLRKKEGVVDYQCRGLEHWRESSRRGDGILLAPNHCRTADPLVMVWPARQLGTHLYAMASWHLFNTNRFESFALQKMGAFSVHREGSDRQSLEMAISVLATAERPLILFPEGTTNRTNDVLKPLLDGVAFIARAAARRRAKHGDGRVVMHPVAMKYVCVGDVKAWADHQLSELERRFGWAPDRTRTILQRTVRVAEAMLALKEIQYLGRSQTGPLPDRRDHLIESLLSQTESELQMDSSAGVRPRVRAIRSEVATIFFRDGHDQSAVDDRARGQLRLAAAKADLAQELLSYLDCYLQEGEVTDTRIIETIQRMQESLLGTADVSIPLKVIIQCDQAIEVPRDKAPRGITDPIMVTLQQRLESMLSELSTEAEPADRVGLA